MDKALRGAKAHKRGHLAEYVALIHLMLKGYRILGFRLKMPQGEIDILAQKSTRLHVVEVKQRRSHEEAFETVSTIQQERLWQAFRKRSRVCASSIWSSISIRSRPANCRAIRSTLLKRLSAFKACQREPTATYG